MRKAAGLVCNLITQVLSLQTTNSYFGINEKYFMYTSCFITGYEKDVQYQDSIKLIILLFCQGD